MQPQSSAMPPKARIPAPVLQERNSAQKIRPMKSRSKERRTLAQQQASSGGQDSRKNFGYGHSNHRNGERSMHEMSLQNNEGSEIVSQQVEMGSGLKQPRKNGKSSPTVQQQPLIPQQRAIYKLLQAFKLQQYSKNFAELGFGEDVYKLTMITHRKKQEILDSIEFLPGHKQRLIDLFRRVDNMYPRQNVVRTLENAQRVGSRQGESRMSAVTITDQSSLNVSAEKHAQAASRDSVNTAHTSNAATASLAMGPGQGGNNPQMLLQTQPVNISQMNNNVSSGIPPPTKFPNRTQNAKSPSSQSKVGKRSNQANSMTRRFNQLDSGTKIAINESFLMNLRSGKTQATTVQDALKEFYGKDTGAKQSIINKIFASDKKQQQSSVKPHPSLASANKAGVAASGSQNGFGLQKFVKVQKGSTIIDKYRSQVSSQGSGKTATKTIQRQSSRTEAQLGRRMDKKTKNSNSSTDSKNLPQPIMIRKGSHQARRKKDTSTSSERREGVTLGMFKVRDNRQQLQTQARQQRVTSHSRIQLQQNSNFMMAPSSSRGDFSKQSSNKNKNESQQNTTTGRTRLHRVRSATGYKDGGAQNNPANASATISSQLNDYSSGSNGPKQVSSQKTAGQQAAMKRIQMHRQRSAKKQITQVQNIDERLQQKQQVNAAPPTGKPATSSTANMPVFIQQQQRNQPATTTAVRRRVSRDRHQYDLSNNASHSIDDTSGTKKQGESTTTDTTNTQEYNTDRLNLLRRASSQGASRGAKGDPSQKNNVDVIGSQRGVRMSSINNKNTGAVSSSLNQSLHAPNSNSIGEAISQSNAFTEFKVITSPAELQAAQAMPKAGANLPPIETKSVSSTVKKVINQKAEDIEGGSFKSTNAVVPATASGKPPMSTSKRSMYSSKAESLKTVESVHNSPQKTGTIKGITEGSPRRPLVLEPIQNPPTVEATASKTNLIQDVTSNSEQEPPIKVQVPVEQQEKINYEEINIKWSPLLDKSDKIEARDYGYSFGSKKVAMGPGFINLRFMCHCLARAIKRHLEFSKGEHWFLQDLQQEQDDIDLEFSYQLPPDLKLTLNPKGVRVSSDDEDDVNPFQREDQSPVRDIETMDIEVDADKQKLSKTVQNSVRSSGAGFGEPEPENIKSSDDEGSGRLSNFKAQNNIHQFSNSKPNQVDDADEIGEEMDEDLEAAYSDGFAEEDPEEQSIKEIRREEMRKSVFEKDEQRLNQFIKERKVSELEHQLKSKDKQIKQLTRLVQTGNTRSEIMAISSPVPEVQDEEEGFFDRGVKMDKAEWLMAQVDLDPIESHGSMEMSTTKFKSLHGKRFVNSEGGQGALEDSRTSRSTKPPINLTAEKKNKKKSQKSYESAFIDVSEDKMREFVMSQLRHFDVRMEYDNLIFNEDQFIPMPSEKYIADYCKYVTIACKMENEIPIVCLVYLEKLLLMTGILLNKWNWRRMVLICLTLASKIWDDDSLENVHFPKVMSDVTNYEINKLEQLFLEFIDYKLVIKGGEYAKYYFILRSMADDINSETQNVNRGSRAITAQQAISPFENGKRNSSSKEEWAEFPLKAPITAGQMLELQKQEAKAEVYLKERHERGFLNAFIGHLTGNGKDKTRHPSMLLDRTM